MNENSKGLTGKIIVLIEDNLFLSDVIVKKLELSGATVFHFSNGLEGLAAIRTHKPDLVLLDIMMPVMNGYEVLQVMHSEGLTDQIPVVVISNSGQPVEIQRVRQLGIKDYLVKADFEPSDVLRKVYEILGLEPSELASPTIEPEMMEKDVEVVPGNPKVMVVEDDPLLRNLLSVKLSSTHCPYMFANDGTVAVDLIRKFNPDIIILDLMLPGKDGFEILEEIKDDPALKKIPVVIFSNKNSEQDRSRAQELGVERFYVKAMTDLPAFVEEVLRIAKMFKKAK